MLDPDMPTQELLLHMGELTANEIRVARAAIRWANSQAIDENTKQCKALHQIAGQHFNNLTEASRFARDVLDVDK